MIENRLLFDLFHYQYWNTKVKCVLTVDYNTTNNLRQKLFILNIRLKNAAYGVQFTITIPMRKVPSSRAFMPILVLATFSNLPDPVAMRFKIYCFELSYYGMRRLFDPCGGGDFRIV